MLFIIWLFGFLLETLYCKTMMLQNKPIRVRVSLRVAVPGGKTGGREGGNVYEKLARIVLCDVKVIYVSYVNKLYFPGKSVCTPILTQTDLFICRFLFSLSTLFCFTLVCEGHFMLCYKETLESSDRACYGKIFKRVCMISAVYICMLLRRVWQLYNFQFSMCWCIVLAHFYCKNEDMFLSLQVFALRAKIRRFIHR